MGVLDAFDSTWSNARTTFGSGTPQDGAQYDASDRLRNLQRDVDSAAPGSRWTGPASDSYASANEKQSRVLGQMADLDQRLRTEVDRSAAVVAAGRRDLDAVRQWVRDAASTVPQNTSGQQMLLPIVRKGAADIAEIVQRSNGDLNAIAGRIRALDGEWQALGDKDRLGPDGKPEDGDVPPEDQRRKAQQDVKAALAGDKGAAARVQRVFNTISGDQLSGHKPLTAEQRSYLSQMQAQQNGMSIDDLQKAEKNGLKGLLADSWQLMSNPHIDYPKTPLHKGALDVPLPHGYYDAAGNHVAPPGAHAVVVNGELVLPAGVSPADYQKAIGQATSAALGPVTDGYSAIGGMVSRYNGVTEDPNPHG